MTDRDEHHILQQLRHIENMLNIQDTKLEIIMVTLSDLGTTLLEVDSKLTDATKRITTEIAELKNSLANVVLPADAQEALDRVTASAEALDNISPPVVDSTPVG
jgi:uncharacterized protein YoxC